MNKAFENILEQLIIMRDKYSKDTTYGKNHISAYNKAISIVQEEAEEYFNEYVPFDNVIDLVESYIEDAKSEGDYHYIRPFELVIQGVRELAKGYNDGWIPCSVRLPEEHKLYDITFKNSAGLHSDSAIYNTYLKRWFWDADETELVENDILAWAEKREPYKERD